MIDKKIIVSALVLTLCTGAMLTSCGKGGSGTENSTDNKVSAQAEENKGPVDSVIDGVQNGVNDIQNGLMDNAEEATHAERDDMDDSARGDGHSDNDNQVNTHTPEISDKGGISNHARQRRTAPEGK